jgi:hypothetical protein
MSARLASPPPPRHLVSRGLCALALAAIASGCIGGIADPTGSAAPGGGSPPGVTPGVVGGVPVTPDPPGCTNEAPLEARIWKLGDDQWSNAVADLLPGVMAPAIATPGMSKAAFVNVEGQYPVTGALLVDLSSSAKAAAAAAVQNLPQRLACPAADAACAQAWVEKFATRAFRRPLDATDKAELQKVYQFGAGTSVANGVRLVIEAVLQSPSFIYRSELGKTPSPGKPVELNSYELASSLSFFLLGSIPDEPLWQAAQDGTLAKQDVYTRELNRLLSLPRVRANLSSVLLKWVGLGDGVTTELPSEQFPDYTADLRAAMTSEADRFFQDVLANGGTLGDLLSSRKTFVNDKLAALYGVPYNGKGEWVPVTLPAEQRSGVLTQAGFLVSKSRGEAMVHRGKWVREQLLCGTIPDPPPGINTDPPAGLNLTSRAFSEMRMADPTCGACHTLMDGVGLAFENYDPLARYATMGPNHAPIDASGFIKGTDVDAKINGALDLATRLSASKQARLCVETKLLSYSLGNELEYSDNRCDVQRLDAQIKTGGGRLMDLVAAIAQSPGFRTRTGGQ